MKRKRFSQLEYGSPIADMHGKRFAGLSSADIWIDGEVEIFDTIEFYGSINNWLNEHVGNLTQKDRIQLMNKYLYVIGETGVSEPFALIVAYSYDDHVCGFAKVREKK